MSREARRKLKERMRDDAIKAFTNDYSAQNYINMAKFRLYNVEKEFRDSFSRYKLSKHLWRDLMQPFVGGYRLVRGLIQVFIMPLLSLFIMLYFAIIAKDKKDVLKEVVEKTLGIIVDGAALVLQGLVQFLKAPFTWLIQIPARSIQTSRKGWQEFKENDGIKALKQEYLQLTASPNPKSTDVLQILFRVEEKYKKAGRVGQKQADKLKLDKQAREFVNSIPRSNTTNEDDQYYSKHERMKYWRKRHYFFGETSIDTFFGKTIKNLDINGTLDAEAIGHATNFLNNL